jgi:hypothetical protein
VHSGTLARHVDNCGQFALTCSILWLKQDEDEAAYPNEEPTLYENQEPQ